MQQPGEIIVAEHRNSSLKDVRLRFIGKYAKFANMDNFDEYLPDSLSPNKDFSQSMEVELIRPVKMNDDDIDSDDDGPFES